MKHAQMMHGTEEDLLLCCARPRLDPAAAERMQLLLREPLDWDFLFETGALHGVLPLLYWRLHTTCPDAVPGSILTRLRAYYYTMLRRNLLSSADLLQLLDRFGAAGIPAIPYKGPVLACSAYENLGLREFNDLDLLVHKEDVLRAQQQLLSAGFSPGVKKGRKWQAYAQFAYRFSFEFPYYREDRDSTVDLHWDLTPSFFHLPAEQLWERLQPALLAGKPVSSLAPEDLLLLLCVHGAKHLWGSLGWICDIGKLLEVAAALDWDRVLGQAAHSRTGRALELGLLLARDLLGAQLPAGISQKIDGDAVIHALAARIRAQLFQPPPASLETAASCRFYMKVREHRRDGLQCCLELGTTPTEADWQFLALPKALFPLYYVLRPFRLAGNYCVNYLRQRGSPYG